MEYVEIPTVTTLEAMMKNCAFHVHSTRAVYPEETLEAAIDSAAHGNC